MPFERERDGRITAVFSPIETQLLVTLTSQLEELLSERATPGDDPLPGLVIGGEETLPDDPALARLLPNAYAESADATEFRQLTERGLAMRKVANARFVAEGADAGAVSLDEAGALRWAQSIGDIRLTLASRIGIVDDDSPIPDDEDSQTMFEVYNWLAGVQDSLVRALE